jgi:hypothetical protein
MPRLGNGRLSGLVGLVLGLWLVAGVPGRADAALLVINDGADVWSLDVQTGCTTCDIVLQVEWGDPSARAGTLLQGVQWQLDGVTITDHGYVSFDPGSDDWWDFGFGVISATGCSGGGSGSACSEWEGPGDGLTVVSDRRGPGRSRRCSQARCPRRCRGRSEPGSIRPLATRTGSSLRAPSPSTTMESSSTMMRSCRSRPVSCCSLAASGRRPTPLGAGAVRSRCPDGSDSIRERQRIRPLPGVGKTSRLRTLH